MSERLEWLDQDKLTWAVCPPNSVFDDDGNTPEGWGIEITTPDGDGVLILGTKEYVQALADTLFDLRRVSYKKTEEEQKDA